MTKTERPPKGLRLEPLSEQHIPAILAIEKQSNGAPWSERSFRNELDHPYGIFRVAMEGTDVVGYAGAWLPIDEAHITTVAVAPEQRRRGIGRKLIIEILTLAKEKGMLCSTLEVRAGNDAARELYASLGYVVSARRKGYYPDNQEDALVMWLHDLKNWNPPSP